MTYGAGLAADGPARMSLRSTAEAAAASSPALGGQVARALVRRRQRPEIPRRRVRARKVRLRRAGSSSCAGGASSSTAAYCAVTIVKLVSLRGAPRRWPSQGASSSARLIGAAGAAAAPFGGPRRARRGGLRAASPARWQLRHRMPPRTGSARWRRRGGRPQGAPAIARGEVAKAIVVVAVCWPAPPLQPPAGRASKAAKPSSSPSASSASAATSSSSGAASNAPKPSSASSSAAASNAAKLSSGGVPYRLQRPRSRARRPPSRVGRGCPPRQTWNRFRAVSALDGLG